MNKLITILTCAIWVSCTDILDAQVEDLNFKSESMELETLQLDYDSITTYRQYFHESHLISSIGSDTTQLMTTMYIGWKLLFEVNGLYPPEYLNNIFHSLDSIDKALPKKLNEQLKESTTISFQSFQFRRGYTGHYFTIDRNPMSALIKINGLQSTGTLMHELMHEWDHLYLRASQYVVSSGLHEIYISAKVNDLWEGSYTVSDYTEYFADLAKYYFLDPEFLRERDRSGFDFIEKIVIESL